MIERTRKRLSKRAKKGFRGWPLATVALYGRDDSTATKLTVGIVPAEDAEAPSVPTTVRHLLPGSLDPEDAEGSPRSCPCSPFTTMPTRVLPRTAAIG